MANCACIIGGFVLALSLLIYLCAHQVAPQVDVQQVPQAPMMLTVTNFTKVLTQSTRPTLVRFTHAVCPSCEYYGRSFEELWQLAQVAVASNAFLICEFNVSADSASDGESVAKALGIEWYPTLWLFPNSQKLAAIEATVRGQSHEFTDTQLVGHRFAGDASAMAYAAWINRVIGQELLPVNGTVVKPLPVVEALPHLQAEGPVLLYLCAATRPNCHLFDGTWLQLVNNVNQVTEFGEPVPSTIAIDLTWEPELQRGLQRLLRSREWPVVLCLPGKQPEQAANPAELVAMGTTAMWDPLGWGHQQVPRAFTLASLMQLFSGKPAPGTEALLQLLSKRQWHRLNFYHSDRSIKSLKLWVNACLGYQLFTVNIDPATEVDETVLLQYRVRELTDMDFFAITTNPEYHVAVLFYGLWCVPCQVVAPIWHELASLVENSTLVIARLNVSNHWDLSKQVQLRYQMEIRLYSRLNKAGHVWDGGSSPTLERLVRFINHHAGEAVLPVQLEGPALELPAARFHSIAMDPTRGAVVQVYSTWCEASCGAGWEQLRVLNGTLPPAIAVGRMLLEDYRRAVGAESLPPPPLYAVFPLGSAKHAVYLPEPHAATTERLRDFVLATAFPIPNVPSEAAAEADPVESATADELLALIGARRPVLVLYHAPGAPDPHGVSAAFRLLPAALRAAGLGAIAPGLQVRTLDVALHPLAARVYGVASPPAVHFYHNPHPRAEFALPADADSAAVIPAARFADLFMWARARLVQCQTNLHALSS